MTTGTKHLAQQWASYRERVVPPDAGELQVQECRRAFYAGAKAVWRALLLLDSGTEDATDEDLARMEGIGVELEEFGEDVKAGRA